MLWLKEFGLEIWQVHEINRNDYTSIARNNYTERFIISHFKHKLIIIYPYEMCTMPVFAEINRASQVPMYRNVMFHYLCMNEGD